MAKPGDKFVRHGGDKTRFTFPHAFRCALEGIAYTFRTQRNFRVQTVFAIVALVMAALLRVPAFGWLAIVVCIGVVFSLECVNTALESLADKVSPEWHELVKRAKDCAAGAVLLAAAMSLVVAAIVYIPALLALV
jgi:diacylglycerol kinase (ATP)